MLEPRIAKGPSRLSFPILVLAFFVSSCHSADAPDFEQGVKRINGTKLFYRAIGEGEPLVIAHGGPGMDQNYLLPQMEELAKQHRLIFYDQRGTGGSSPEIDPAAITIEQFVDDLDEIRKAFDIEKMNLLGHSWGGLLSMYYATTHPDKMKTLILANTMPATSEFWASFAENLIRNRKPADSLALSEIAASEEFAAKSPAALRNYWQIFFRSYFYDQSLSYSLNLEQTKTTWANGDAVSNLLWEDRLEDFDIYDQLASVSCPTLIVHGDFDPVPLKYAQEIHETIANSQLVILENSGHFSYIETPAEFYSAVTDFLKNGHD
ncbi:MAG: proline iminopeptidase-family hydrolase [Deltaproteobacteria bacterium]|nr:proline iminopeptidase-family hydrolase [Deltaproteobacteria bacterium]